jgi:hypothetical protein
MLEPDRSCKCIPVEIIKVETAKECEKHQALSEPLYRLPIKRLPKQRGDEAEEFIAFLLLWGTFLLLYLLCIRLAFKARRKSSNKVFFCLQGTVLGVMK